MRNLMAVPAVLLLLVAAACSDPTANYARAKTGAAVNAPIVEAGADDKELAFSNDNSKLSFRGAKVTAAHPGGFKKFTGKLLTDGKTVKRVEVDVDVTTIWAGDEGKPAGEVNEKLTGHLKSADFFNVEKFPTARFVTTSITPIQGTKHKVVGNLTMLETTKSVEFEADITMNEGKASAKAKFKIDRNDWGIVYKGMADDLIKNDVGLEFDITAQ